MVRRGFFGFGLIVSAVAAALTAQRIALAGEGPVAPKAMSLAKPVVVIDPGHGGVDPGMVVEEVIEKDLVLDYGRRIAKEIERNGLFEVFLTRSTDEFV